ncbi:MAG: GGDEF domain-containing protein [Deltaproteobacteria bacterium]|jgi:diguanylate cyclase|nr:GGDEF domain-containing protein [Deltaproteobacteria bacterium]
MVDTKREGDPGLTPRAPERRGEADREFRRLEGDKEALLRAVRPLLHVAAVALARERREGEDPPYGTGELSCEVEESVRAIRRGEPDPEALAGLSERLGSHFRVKPDARPGRGRGEAARPSAPPLREEGAAPPASAYFDIGPFAKFLELAGELRGGRYLDQVRVLRAAVSAGEGLDGFAATLSAFLLKLAGELSSERRDIAARLSTIIRTLVNLENEFRSFLEKSITYLDENEASFIGGVSQRVESIQERLAEAKDNDVNGLISLIAEEMELISSAIRRKTEDDESRLAMLRDEKVVLESSLDTVRRDYDSFVQQSKRMLREIEEMRAIALRDGLTKVFNRRAYDEQLLLTLLNFKTGKLAAFSLVIFDIDHFRDVNNRYGHQAGDRILVHMAGSVTAAVRSDDFVFRYGGDEFVILLPGASLSDACMVAEKIRRSVDNVEFVIGKGGTESLRVTISMGVAEARPGDTPGSILARADKALYASKRAGRNRVTAADDEFQGQGTA